MAPPAKKLSIRTKLLILPPESPYADRNLIILPHLRHWGGPGVGLPGHVTLTDWFDTSITGQQHPDAEFTGGKGKRITEPITTVSGDSG